MKLNWLEIKSKFPKAFAELVKDHETIKSWGRIDDPNMWGILVEEDHYVMRHLFDFFDKRKVMVEIGVDFTRSGYGMPLYCYQVNLFGTGEHLEHWSDLFRSRPEAEVEGWLKAFEILEKQL